MNHKIGDRVNYLIYRDELGRYESVNGVIIDVNYDEDAQEKSHVIREDYTDIVSIFIWNAGINFSLTTLDKIKDI